jgi:hypothetical protein
VIREKDIQADRRSRNSCQLGHAEYDAMLQRVWSELDYRIDVCRVTRGGHVECV